MSKGFLSDAEREHLSTYPTDLSSAELGRFFTLTQRDIDLSEQQRGDHNRLGFALQLCTLRYLGFVPNNLLNPPAAAALFGNTAVSRSNCLSQTNPIRPDGRCHRDV